MKKTLLLLAVMVVTIMASCVSDELQTGGSTGMQQVPIKLSAYTKGTRAETTAIPSTASIMVMATLTKGEGASKTVTEFIPWQSYDMTDGTFVQGPYFWPQEGTLSFYAYYYDAAGVSYRTLAESIADGFTEPVIGLTGYGNMDLVVSRKLDVSVSDATSGVITLEFEHPLAELNINAQGDDADCQYELTGITLLNTLDAATYKYQDSTWTSGGQAAPAPSNMSLFVRGNSPKYVSTTQMESVCSVDNSLASFFIPGTYTLEVRYKVTYKTDGTVMADFTSDNGARTVQVTIDKGYRTNVNLTLSFQKPISFTASVTGFTQTSPNQNAQ